LKKISSAKKEMYQQIGRIPSTQELAKYLEMTEEKVLQYSSTSRSVVSLELPMRSSDTIKEDRRTIGDYIVSDAPTPEEHAQGQNLKQDIRAVVNGLAAKERDVLVYRFGLDNGEPMTVDETASRLGISRDRVRLVEARAINKLRSPQRNYRLKEYVGGGQNHHHHPSYHHPHYDGSTGGQDDRLPRSNALAAEDESKKVAPPRMTPERLWSF
jgi:RNA polymerase primary sigma factor